MTVAPMASALPVRAGRQIRPTLDAYEADLFVSTVDANTRRALRGPTATMRWTTGQNLWLTRRDGIVLLSHSPDPTRARTVAVVLDSRCRVLLPYFIRIQNNWKPGVRLMLVAAPVEGVAAALPVSRVVSAFLGDS